MIEDIIKAAMLGAVQGLTEFLPVSSTGHLILAEEMLGIDQDRYGLAFDASLHMGTLLALLAYFGTRWVRLTRAGIDALLQRSFADSEARLAWLIVLATIPAGAIGFVLESKIEDAFRAPWLVATVLIAFSAVFFIAEALGERVRRIDGVTPADAILVGVAQSLALVPGVSRSGATISAGLLRNFERRDATTFAFLLSAPITAAAGLRASADALRGFADGTLGRDDAVFFITGMIVAAVVGYGAISALIRFLTTNTLRPFAWYRIGLGLAVFGVLIVRAVF